MPTTAPSPSRRPASARSSCAPSPRTTSPPASTIPAPASPRRAGRSSWRSCRRSVGAAASSRSTASAMSSCPSTPRACIAATRAAAKRRSPPSIAEPGRKAIMPIHVAASAGQNRWSGYVEPQPGLALPCTIIRGRRPGPKLLVTAGVHGAEYSAIEAGRRLTALDPDRLSGELTILPIVNIKAFWSHQPYINPLDGKNINRVFPGDANGTASDRLAAWLVETAMAEMDCYIDLHCGDIIEALLPFAIFPDGDARSGELAMAS